MLHWYPIKELMHKLTGLNVEKSAIFELTNYFEEQIEKIILQSKKEMLKLNKMKKIQGLYVKHRIDRDCIRNAIKSLNENSDSHMSEKGGKVIKEKKENIEVQ
jgi:hypothetical protein